MKSLLLILLITISLLLQPKPLVSQVSEIVGLQEMKFIKILDRSTTGAGINYDIGFSCSRMTWTVENVSENNTTQLIVGLFDGDIVTATGTLDIKDGISDETRHVVGKPISKVYASILSMDGNDNIDVYFQCGGN